MPIIPVKGVSPEIPASSWVAENATITGDVVCGEECSIWFQVVIRGDVNKIHRAIIHGCKINDNVLIGMGAIVLDDVVVESNVIVAAGAVVTSGSVLKSGFLYAGIPAKQIKPLEEEKVDYYIKGTAAAYVEYSSYYKK